jgi:hypothetical protein
MANPTTNYNFVLPTASDLVTDLPADFDVALQGVDTRLKALQPGTTLGDLAYSSATANTNTRLGIGTTGQVLTVVGGVPAWQTGTTGDIEGVTAGVGISGGGTSGTVTVTNSMATAIDAKGDLIVGTGADTFSRLAVGATNGMILSVDSAEATGLKYITPAAAGGMTSIASGSLGSAGTTLSSISGSYKELKLVITNFATSISGGNCWLRVNNDSTASRHGQVSSGTTAITFSETKWALGSSIATTGQNTIVVDFYNYTGTTNFKTAMLYGFVQGAGSYNYTIAGLAYNQTTAITSLGIVPSGGTFTMGDYVLYGVN